MAGCTRRAAGGAALGAAFADAGAATPTARLGAWRQAHPTVRFAPEAAYGPFVYADDAGAIAGLSVDVLHAVAQRAGLGLRTLLPATLPAIFDAVRAGEADLVSSLRPTQERAAFLRFSRPYVNVPAVLAVATGSATSLTALAGRPVAVGAGYAVETFVRQRHPSVRWVALPTDTHCLKSVADRSVAAAVLDVASLAFVDRNLRIAGLRVVERIGFDYPLSFAVRADWPELAELLDMGLAALPAPELQRMVDHWLGPFALQIDQLPWPRGATAGAALTGLGALLGLAAWRRRRQRPAS